MNKQEKIANVKLVMAELQNIIDEALDMDEAHLQKPAIQLVEEAIASYKQFDFEEK